MCARCDKFAMQIQKAGDETSLQEELSKHHIEADLGYKSKSADKGLSKNDPSKITLTFDLQQCPPTPDVKNSVAFYKRQLWTFDLTIHVCNTGQAYCYVWQEAMAKRGGNGCFAIFKTFTSYWPHVSDFRTNLHGVWHQPQFNWKTKKKFNGQAEHPHDWANLIRQTGKRRPFIVKELERDNFYHFSGLLNGALINRKSDTDGK